MLTNHDADSFIKIKYPEEKSIEWSRLDSSYRLLELSDSRLLAAFEDRKEMCIRGGVNDDAVLCTEDQTFRLRDMVTSNMFLVVETSPVGSSCGELTGRVVGKPQATLEATPLSRPPGIDQLISALNSSPYNGGSNLGEDEEFAGNDCLHVSRLYENIQASAKEIEQCLKEQGALVINDHYRKLGSHLLCRFFELLINTAILEDWNLRDDPINSELIWQAFKQYEDEFPKELTDFIMLHYTDCSDGKFNFVKLSRFLAEQLLSARAVWDCEEFLLAWEKSFNDLYQPEMENIKDLMLINEHPGSGRLELKRFLRSDLPSNVESRFISLFKTRSRWQYNDLIPFISDLGRDGKELDAIVLKHGRVSTHKEVRYITPRSQLLD